MTQVVRAFLYLGVNKLNALIRKSAKKVGGVIFNNYTPTF